MWATVFHGGYEGLQGFVGALEIVKGCRLQEAVETLGGL